MTHSSRLSRLALFFDYDGVIADTEPLHWKSWQALLQPLGYRLEWEEYCRLARGVNDMRFFNTLSQKIAMPSAAEFEEQNIHRVRLVREWSLAKVPILPETISLLRGLGGYRIALVTSSERADVEPVLRAACLDESFEVCIFGDDVARHKPAPDPYLLASRELGVTCGIVFEDSSAGIESARAAGLTAIRIENPLDLPRAVDEVLRGLGE